MAPYHKSSQSSPRQYRGQPSHPIPVWNGILEHAQQIGPAIWEFLWLLDKITQERDGIGWCLGRMPIKVERIAADLRESEHTVRINLAQLERGGYILRVRTPHGYSIGVRNSRKFDAFRQSDRQKTDDHIVNGALQIGSFRPSDRQKTADVEKTLQRHNKREEKNKNAEAQTASALVSVSPVNPGEQNRQPSPTTLAAKRRVTVEEEFGEEVFRELLKFEEYRQKIRRPLTEYGMELLLRKLAKLKAAGNDPILVLQQSIMNGWVGVFELQNESRGGAKANGKSLETELAELLERSHREHGGKKVPN